MLRDAGSWFADASLLFKDEPRTVYMDTCCHFNELGLTSLARYIASEIVSRSRIIRAKAAASRRP